MSRVYIPNLIWEPLADPNNRFDGKPVMDRMEQILSDWSTSHYESGASLRGIACDCIGGVFGVVDDLDGQKRACRSPLPQDSAMHNREAAIATMKQLVNRFEPNSHIPQAEDGYFYVQPGDIVVTGYPGGGPGHVEIVGPRRNTLWHALPQAGFHQTGFGFLEGRQLLWRIYRLGDRWRWTR